jgi:hypothetical protein
MRTSVILEIGPGRLVAAIMRRGRVVFSRTTYPNVGSTAGLPEMIKASENALIQMVDQFGVTGAQTLVISALPDEPVAMFSCSASITTDDARRAASLSILDSTGLDPRGDSVGACLAWTDSPPSSVQDGPEQTLLQKHLLVAGASDLGIREVASQLRAVGLRLSAVVPGPALGMREAIVTAASGGAGPSIAMHIGQHNSALALAVDGRLIFCRRLTIGRATLATAITRELRTTVDGQEGSVHFSLAQADQAWARNGLPRRGTMFDSAQGVAAETVLPLIQPFVQRLSIDLKQSIRFGVRDTDRTRVRLRVIGPGALIARLPEAIATQAGLDLEEQDRPAPSVVQEGDIEAWIRRPLPELVLWSKQIRIAHRERRLRAGILTGAAAALALLGIDAWFATSEVQQVEHRIGLLQTRLQAATVNGAIAKRTVEVSRLNESVKQTVLRWGQPSIPAGLLLAELSAATPPTVRFSEVHLSAPSGVPNAVSTLRLRGVASSRDDLGQFRGDGDSTAQMQMLTSAIRAIPIVRSAALRSVQRLPGSAEDRQEFELAIELADPGWSPIGDIRNASAGGTR